MADQSTNARSNLFATSTTTNGHQQSSSSSNPKPTTTAGSSSSSVSSSSHASMLMNELACAKVQEHCLVQILSKCTQVMNKLRAEELQLRVIVHDEKEQPGVGGIQNGMITPSSILSVSSANETETEDNNFDSILDEVASGTIN